MRVVVMLVLVLTAVGCDSVFGANEPIVSSTGGAGGAEHDDLDTGGSGGGSAGAPPIAAPCDGDRDVQDVVTGACFHSSETLATWDDARAACQAMGGDLATILSADQLAVVQDVVRDTSWTGGSRAAGSDFEWVSGVPWTFEDWIPGDPVAQGDCVAVDGALLAFSNLDCTAMHPSVCQTGGATLATH